jgi:Tol biopolymer transport system component
MRPSPPARSRFPARTRIALATQRFGNLDIAIMNADGTNVRRLTSTTHEDIEPAWRPDGQEIVFTPAARR